MRTLQTSSTLRPAGQGLGQPPRTTVPAGDRPVLLVHGFRGTPSGWLPVAAALRARGLDVATMSYRSFGTTVEQIAQQLAAEVARLRAETSADTVHLVGHSLGGVVIAEAIASGLLTGQVATVVTLAAPFGGSPWASLLPVGTTLRSLREGSPLLRRLREAPVPDGVRWLAVSATADLVVPGRRSVPGHARVEAITIEGLGHVGLRMHPEVVQMIVDALPKPESAAA